MTTPPRLPFHRFVGRVPQLLTDRAEGLRRIADDYGDVVRVPVPGKPFYLLSSPAFAERVLKTNHQNYRKSFDWRIVATFLGAGMITSHDEVWKRARSAAQPAFRGRSLRAMVDPLGALARKECAQWSAVRPPFMALERLTLLSLKLFAGTLFRVDVGDEAQAISKAMVTALRHLDRRLAAIVDVSAFLPTPSRVRFHRARRLLDEIAARWVAQRCEIGLEGEDLLSMLIVQSRALPDEADRDIWLRDQIMTALAAGHETVAVAMTWCLYMVARHPAVQKQLADEVEQVLAGRAPSHEDLARLPYCEQVIRETLRLYPPVWSLGRETIEKETFGEYTIPARSTVVVSPYVIHRRADLWPDSDVFDPDRFAEPADRERREFDYLPFSSGPRFCIGGRMATVELQVILATVIQRYHVRAANERPVGMEALISLRPKPDIPLLLEPRAQS